MVLITNGEQSFLLIVDNGDLQWGEVAHIKLGPLVPYSTNQATREGIDSNMGISRLSAYRVDQNNRDVVDPIYITPGRY